jgi:diaminopimelate decarboxylase
LNTMDVFALRRKLPEPRVGEALAICDAGAYSISRASRYAGLSPPVFLARVDGSIEQIRRREGLADLTSAMDAFDLSEELTGDR